MKTTFTVEVRRDLNFTDHKKFGKACELLERFRNGWNDEIWKNRDITSDWDNVGSYIHYPTITFSIEGRETVSEEVEQDKLLQEYRELKDMLNRYIKQVLDELNDGG